MIRHAAVVGMLLASDLSAQRQIARLESPDGKNVISFTLDADSALRYSVSRAGRTVFAPSRLGFAFRGAPTLQRGLRVVDTVRATRDTTWSQPWGEVARVRDWHNELRVRVAEVSGLQRSFVLVARAFNDGVAFRYDVPTQPALGAVARLRMN
jgi:alpha-glucosidase